MIRGRARIASGRNSDVVIDGLQYCRWSEKIFRQMRAGGVDAVHTTIVYHEDYPGTLGRLDEWSALFDRFADHVAPGRIADDILRAQSAGKTAVFFGLQNCKPVEDDLARIEDLYDRGVRFMQTVLQREMFAGDRMGRRSAGRGRHSEGAGSDCRDEPGRHGCRHVPLSRKIDSGGDRAVGPSHCRVPRQSQVVAGHRAQQVRNRPEGARRVGRHAGVQPLSASSRRTDRTTTLQSFCDMAARTADLMGVEQIGIGSDLCQDQPDSIVRWMRSGVREDENTPPPESVKDVRFPEMPVWFRSNEDFPGIARTLRDTGFSAEETAGIMGNNWFRFMNSAFGPRTA